MKKNILRTFIGMIFLGAFILPGCEFLEECGTCVLVTDDGTDVSETPPLIYCGDDYQDKLNSGTTTVGTTISYWDCY